MYSAALNPVLVNRVQLHVEYEHTAQILHRPCRALDGWSRWISVRNSCEI